MVKIHKNFLSLPDVIEANNIPSGANVPNGIIAQIRSSVSDITSYVEPSIYGSPIYGKKDALVKWDSYTQPSGRDAYWQVEFKQGYVYPTFYSLKGSDGYGFVKEWVLYGFNSLSEEKVILSKNKSEGSTFCGTSGFCNGNNWGTFSIDPVKKAFKYFRMMSITPSNDGWHLMSAGFELFGIYSTDGKTPATIKKNRKRMRTCVPINKISFYCTIMFTTFICK